MAETLYSTRRCAPDTQQLLLACLFLRKDIPVVDVNSAKFDPVTLVTPSGMLNQPNAILRYICGDSQLAGAAHRNQITQWFERFNIELHPVLTELYQQTLGFKASHSEKFIYALKELKRELEVINHHLKDRTFLVGDTLSCLDVSLACHLELPFKLLISEEQRKRLTNIQRWYTYVRNTEPFLQCFGKMFLCGKATYHVSDDLVKDEKKEEKKEQKRDSVKKSTKQSQSEKSVQKSTFDINEFKRQFQNSPNREEVVVRLLNQLDAGWSIWKIHYEKDVGEGKVDYITMNMALGSLQRLDSLRKEAFGTLGVYSGEQGFQIRGVMLWRGVEVVQNWKDHPSYSYHVFSKLNCKKESDRKLICDYWLERNAEGLELFKVSKLI